MPEQATVHPMGSNCPFTQDSCTVACQLSREQSPAAGADEGAEPAHAAAETPYITQRDAVVYVARMLYALVTLAEENAFPRGSTVAAVVTGRPSREHGEPFYAVSRYAAASSRSSRRSKVRSISSSR
ncbi:hypothetical protein GCM10027162_08230 [Streptomyces incanus]